MLASDAVISLQKTGGFAGVSYFFEQKLGDLKTDKREKLESLIANCELLEVTDLTEINKHARDVLYFSFELTESGKVHKARFDTLTISDAYKQLADWLQEHLAAQP